MVVSNHRRPLFPPSPDFLEPARAVEGHPVLVRLFDVREHTVGYPPFYRDGVRFGHEGAPHPGPSHPAAHVGQVDGQYRRRMGTWYLLIYRRIWR